MKSNLFKTLSLWLRRLLKPRAHPIVTNERTEMEDWLSSLLEENPRNINFRYITHMTIVRHGQWEKLVGAPLKRFLEDAPEFDDVEQADVALNWALLLRDTQEEWDYIKASVRRNRR